jgi:hypothetical protein
MIEKDAEFYRKWLAVCQLSTAYPLQMTISGDKLYISCRGKLIAEIAAALFAKATPKEILKIIGVKENEQII